MRAVVFTVGDTWRWGLRGDWGYLYCYSPRPYKTKGGAKRAINHFIDTFRLESVGVIEEEP